MLRNEVIAVRKRHTHTVRPLPRGGLCPGATINDRATVHHERELRDYCCRIYGWDDAWKDLVDEATQSLLAAVARGAAIALRGEADLVPTAYALHRRLLGFDRPFVVCDPRRGDGPGSVRSPPNCRAGLDALMAAAGGSIFIRARRLPADFDALTEALRGPGPTAQVFICLSDRDRVRDLLSPPIEIPALGGRAADLDRLAGECLEEATRALGVGWMRFSGVASDSVLRSVTSLAEIERVMLRLVALKSPPNLSQAARRLRVAPVSLSRWLHRRRPTIVLRDVARLEYDSEIRNYIESEAPMIPNAVVVAFDSRVTFVAARGPATNYSRVGELLIPVDLSWTPEERPGFIVDGQQRLAAVRDAAVDSFPICVSAFITDDVGEQTEQFILVNSTKPLPKGLIYELLPRTETALPSLLARRRLPATILTRLNREENSPLRGMIQTATNPTGVIKDNSILKMLENSLSDGALYRVRQGMSDDSDLEPMLGILFSFWSAVREVFGADWGLPPKRSRLLHGAGVVCLGFVMDAIADRYRSKGLPTKGQFSRDLTPLAQICAWSTGHWEFGAGQYRKWNEIQNTSKDIQLLSNYLLVQYKGLVWNRSTSRERQLNLT